MVRETLLPFLVTAALAGALSQASAQTVSPAETAMPAEPTAAAAPQSFTSAAQARTYLAQNPTGARAEQAFRKIVDSDLAAQNPDFDPAAIAGGRALVMLPGATAAPAQIEAIIDAATPGIGARSRRWF
jgi:hypothetical protein